MKKENQLNPLNTSSPSRETDAIRDFFTAMLATVAVAALVFGLFSKGKDLASGENATMLEASHEVPNAKSTFREFAQAAGEAQVADETAYAMLLAEIEDGNTPAADLYVAAAKELLNRGAGSDAKAIIQAGVMAHPDDAVMTLGSIDVRAATGEAMSAWTELAQTGDTSNPEIMSRLIKYATSADKVDETMTILGDLKKLPWTPSTQDWSNLVNMLTEAGRIDDAQKASKLSPESDQLTEKLKAIERLEDGDYKKARDTMKAYIDDVENPTPEDWALLAEAYVGLGDTSNADDAFREAEGLKKEQTFGGGGGFFGFLADLFGFGGEDEEEPAVASENSTNGQVDGGVIGRINELNADEVEEEKEEEVSNYTGGDKSGLIGAAGTSDDQDDPTQP